MDYLSFDIEAANGYKPYSICSIGIVIADENFNVKTKENIWINPKTKYNLNGTRRNVGIDLHLDKALIAASPEFPAVYNRVKQLLTGPVCVLGHAVESDVIMLNAACRRHNLPSIDFTFICSQLLFKLYRGDKEVRALNKIADEIGITFSPHDASEDAYASLMTLKYLATQTRLSVDELIEKYSVRRGQNKNFEMTRTVTLEGQVPHKNVRAVAERQISAIIRELTIGKKPNKKGIYSGKTFAIARSLEFGEPDRIRNILTRIYAAGGTYTGKIGSCDYYLKHYTRSQKYNLESDRMREANLAEREEAGKVIIISLNDLIYQTNPQTEAEAEKAEQA